MSSRPHPVFYPLAYICSVLFIIYIGIYWVFFRQYNTSYSIFHTSPIRNEQAVSVGYTLISPYNNLLNNDSKNTGSIYLLDMFGKPVHTWTTSRQTFSAQLTPEGSILAAMEAPSYATVYPGGGNTGTIQKLDWNSRVVWQYTNDRMHHDFAVLDNGNIAVTLWEKTPQNIAMRVQGGVRDTELQHAIWSDELAEIDTQGNIVWSWHAYEHMDPAIDIIDPALPRAGWTYINGLTHVAHNPIDGEEAYLISVRSTDTLMFVRKRDGAIIWRSPKGFVNTQHDPTITAKGTILAFDNGFTRLPNPYPLYGSRVVEIDPKTNTLLWKFDGGAGVMDKFTFYGALVGGAQPLANGNVLITDGPRGHVFEVTHTGEVVWDMISPYTTKQTGAFPVNFLFKARRYTSKTIHFPSSIAPAYNPALYTILRILRPIYPN